MYQSRLEKVDNRMSVCPFSHEHTHSHFFHSLPYRNHHIMQTLNKRHSKTLSFVFFRNRVLIQLFCLILQNKQEQEWNLQRKPYLIFWVDA